MKTCTFNNMFTAIAAAKFPDACAPGCNNPDYVATRQSQSMAELAAAETNLVSAKCSRMKFEIANAKERLSVAKKAAKALGCVMPVSAKRSNLRVVAGRVSRTFG